MIPSSIDTHSCKSLSSLGTIWHFLNSLYHSKFSTYLFHQVPITTSQVEEAWNEQFARQLVTHDQWWESNLKPLDVEFVALTA